MTERSKAQTYTYEGGPLNGRRIIIPRPHRYRDGTGTAIKSQRGDVMLDSPGTPAIYVLDRDRLAYVWTTPKPCAERRGPQPYPRLLGHGLVGEGMPFTASGKRAFPYVDSRGGRGYARCECGELSPSLLDSQAQRQRWHREHKTAVSALDASKG
jgi:hypothetical protein